MAVGFVGSFELFVPRFPAGLGFPPGVPFLVTILPAPARGRDDFR